VPKACSAPLPSEFTDRGARSDSTIGELRRHARDRLAAAAARAIEPREATLLLARVLERSEAALLSHGEAPVDRTLADRFERLLERRLEGEPFAYLVGEREFYGRSFEVDRRVLIPRPETEHLVAAVLERAPRGARVADLGTGSGCIALTLALERGDLSVVATDCSLPALRVAAANRLRLGLAGGVDLVAGDLFQPLALELLDVVASNPPYVDPAQRDSLQVEVRDHEPPEALFSGAPGAGGVESYRRLLAPGTPLRPGALLVLEIGAGQLDAVRDLAAAAYTVEHVVVDYGGIPRVAVLRRTRRR
jgi:release factor glutamine methyltransferase